MEDQPQPKRFTRSRIWLGLTILVLAGVALIGADRGAGFNWRSFSDSIRQLPQASSTPRLNVSRDLVKEQSAVIDVVKSASASVVSIGVQTPQRPSMRLFTPFGIQEQPGARESEQSIATGFILSKDGLIVTNKHVVTAGADAKYVVVTYDNKKYDVKNIYRDLENDLAILKVEANNLTPLNLGDSSQLQVGQYVIAIGNALGEFSNTVTTGVVSGIGRGITAGDPFGGFQERLDNLIQTDAAVNPGNSGGPLLDIVGNVIGVNVATSAQAQNISFAIPINTVKDSVSRFNAGGQFSRAYLGVSHRQIDRRTALLNSVPVGAYVMEILPGSPADKAGIKVDDIITKVSTDEVTTENGGLAKLVAKHKVGDRVTISYWREDKDLQTTVTLEEAPSQ